MPKIYPPLNPERGDCEPRIRERPAVHPEEAPAPLPQPQRIPVPNWPKAPVKSPQEAA